MSEHMSLNVTTAVETVATKTIRNFCMWFFTIHLAPFRKRDSATCVATRCRYRVYLVQLGPFSWLGFAKFAVRICFSSFSFWGYHQALLPVRNAFFMLFFMLFSIFSFFMSFLNFFQGTFFWKKLVPSCKPVRVESAWTSFLKVTGGSSRVAKNLGEAHHVAKCCTLKTHFRQKKHKLL